MKWMFKIVLSQIVLILLTTCEAFVLNSNNYESYFKQFNLDDRELYIQYVDNKNAWKFLVKNIPLFDCPDKIIEKTYYFRWWTFRKHIKQLKNGKFVITEFLPNVTWAGVENTISCAAGHHFREGRWLHDPQYLINYAQFWLDPMGGNPRQYSFWIANSLRSLYLVTGNSTFLAKALPPLIRNYETIEQNNLDSEKELYFNTDNRDGMEMSISGDMCRRGYRPTLNSYQFGDAVAIHQIARQLRDPSAARYRAKAVTLRRAVEQHLWDGNLSFFRTVPYGCAKVSGLPVRELHGFTPWYFNLPSGDDKLLAWRQLSDTTGFMGRFGLTSAEQRHAQFSLNYAHTHECQWNGPSWPYATSITLTALANVLSSGRYNLTRHRDYVSSHVFFKQLKTYARAHQRHTADSEGRAGRDVAWLDENLDPRTGVWLSRELLRHWEKDSNSWSSAKGGEERGKDYNHSTFVDLIINGLIGLRPRQGDTLEIRPLVPPGLWPFFSLDRVLYHGHLLSLVWDSDGQRYKLGQGMRLFVDGKLAAAQPDLSAMTVTLK